MSLMSTHLSPGYCRKLIRNCYLQKELPKESQTQRRAQCNLVLVEAVVHPRCPPRWSAARGQEDLQITKEIPTSILLHCLSRVARLDHILMLTMIYKMQFYLNIPPQSPPTS